MMLEFGPEHVFAVCRLQPTRAIGDAYLKQSEFNATAPHCGRHIPPPYTPPYITGALALRISNNSRCALCNVLPPAAKPELRVHALERLDAQAVVGPPPAFLILACDGVWDGERRT